MVMLNIDMPASCEDCPYKGARWCYLEVLRKKEPKEVPEEGRAEWCPMIDLDDDGNVAKALVICMFAPPGTVLVAKQEDWNRMIDNGEVWGRKDE